MQQDLKRALEAVKDIPPIPRVVNDVMSAVGNPSTSADDLRRVIELDPSIAARLLRVANSSLYGFRREVESLRHAITLLGFRTIESTVMAASLREVFVNFGLSEKLLWEHSTLCGVVARKLASYGPIDVESDSAFTAGLLHDLGKIVMSNVYRARYVGVIARTYNEGTSFIEAERHEFAFDHAVLGAYVAETWGLPEGLVAAIRNHHESPDSYAHLPAEHTQLTALTSVATRVCTKLGHGRRGPVECIDLTELPAWGALGLTADDVDAVTELAIEEAKRAAGLFG